MSNISIIGAGFSSLSAACYLARDGHRVSVYEKNSTAGGRARQLESDGFKFDMGPTFYWMPDIFEKFFADFQTTPEKYYKLFRLDPGYRIWFGDGDWFDQPADRRQLCAGFDRLEPGSGAKLDRYLESAAFNYRTAIDKVIYRPARGPMELIMPETVMRLTQFTGSLSDKVGSLFTDPRIRQMLEFPVLFLGAKPSDTPSFYRFMNYADMVLGSWHVEGGMAKVAEGMRTLAESLGVRFHFNSTVGQIETCGSKVTALYVGGRRVHTDAVVSGADYRHTETLLPPGKRNYSHHYWNRKVFAPSAILYYVGFDKKIENVEHHTLFFDTSFEQHARHIYDEPGWPADPMFYASFPSKTDSSFAPPGCESAVILIPTAAGLKDHRAIRDHYFRQIIRRMETLTGQTLADSIVFRRSYGCPDFMSDYNSYKGNAYGLANTVMQTAFLRPSVRNRRLKNMFYTGQLTVPGPGVPTALVSGKVASGEVMEYLKNKK